MRWGRKLKQQRETSSSSFSFSLSNPFSWISKLAKITTKPKSPPARPNPNPNPSPRSPPPPAAARGRSASFHGGFDEPRRLSVGDDDSLLARNRTIHARSLLRSARHNSVGDLDYRPFSSCRPEFEFPESHSRRSRVSAATSEIERPDDAPVLLRRRPPRRRRRRSEETEGIRIPPPIRLKPIETGFGFQARKSFSGRIRRRSKPRVRVYSPRLAARKFPAAAAVAGGLEGFAVVKCSCDPQRDFRESMVEMIWERRIGRPDELERLLACYLSLNSDEHHDVIVKVFRQLWFDLNS